MPRPAWVSAKNFSEQLPPRPIGESAQILAVFDCDYEIGHATTAVEGQHEPLGTRPSRFSSAVCTVLTCMQDSSPGTTRFAAAIAAFVCHQPTRMRCWDCRRQAA